MTGPNNNDTGPRRAQPYANDDEPENETFGPGDEWDEDDALEDGDAALDGLRAVARLAKLLPGIDWFGAAGRPLSAAELNEAESYCAALGFFDTSIGGIATWRQAADAVADPDWSSELWEAEDQAHQALLELAEQFLPVHDLHVALNHVSLRAGELALAKAIDVVARVGLEDEELVKAAGQAAAQAAYQAALVLAVQAVGAEITGLDDGESHAFAAKFRLYELGRWPLGLAGNTFSVF